MNPIFTYLYVNYDILIMEIQIINIGEKIKELLEKYGYSTELNQLNNLTKISARNKSKEKVDILISYDSE